MTAYDYLISAIGNRHPDECLIWPFQKDRDGYGRVSLPLSLGHGKIKVAAHRLAFKIIHDRWPEPCGLHTCDNPSCFNPLHIWEGTNADNQADKVSKKRQVRGVDQHDAKLDDDAVRKIRELYSTGSVSMLSLAKDYNVSRPAIRFAVRGVRTWKHVANPIDATSVRKMHKTHCYRGHPLSEDTCYIYGKVRQCKKCTQIRAQNRT